MADLYDPLPMPPNLVKAHQALDAAVDVAYGRRGFKHDAERATRRLCGDGGGTRTWWRSD